MAANKKINKNVLSWAIYDWANSAFATTVIAALFPIFFKQYWSHGQDVSDSTFYLGLANSVAALILAVASPIIGSIADRGTSKLKFLISFTIFGIINTFALFFVDKGDWQFAALLYIFSVIGFNASIVFYDSIMTLIAPKKDYDFVSVFGFALGYLGGAILFSINALMILKPDWFGFADKIEATRVCFLTVGFWWMLFSIPLIRTFKEKHIKNEFSYGQLIRNSLSDVYSTFTHIKQYRILFLFLLSYFFYIDGVNTIIKMAADFGLSIGLQPENLMIAILIVNYVSFPATFLYAYIAKKISPDAGILFAITVYCFLIIGAYHMQTIQHFFGLAIGIGLVQGGLQALSRSYFGRLIPEGRSAEFFGFYNMVGKFSAIIGPVLMGWVGLMTKSPRLSILSILILFVAGGGIFIYVMKHNKQEKLKLG